MDDTNKKATKELVDMIHYVAEESTKDAPYDRTRKGRVVEVHRNISTNEIIGYDVKIEDKEYYIKKEQGKNITASVNDIVYVNFPCNNVNNIYLSHIDGEEDIYSTSEVKTNGVWIDGKPIYRKVLSTGAINDTNIKNISTPNDIDVMVSMNGFITIGEQQYVPLNYINIYNQTQDVGCFYYKATNTIQIRTYAIFGVTSGFIIIEYTKTT